MDTTSQILPHEPDEQFIVRFETWEGPIEALLDLARAQKLDLSSINILDLVDQFEQIVGQAMALRIELAADWLVMAAWLTYLKSRLLLKKRKDKREDEVDEDDLAYHLKRLNAVKAGAERLESRMRLGRDWFAPAERATEVMAGGRLAIGFHDFLKAYPRSLDDTLPTSHHPNLKPFDLVSVDGALARLAETLTPEWREFLSLIPASQGLKLRSHLATSLIASLELTRRGHADFQQDDLEGPIMVRGRLNHD